MPLYRLADGLSAADVQGMSLDPQSSDPDGYQNPRDLVSEPATDGQDPATPGGAAPYNGAEPTGQPVTTDPMWKSPDEPKKPPYSPTPYTGPGPSVDVTTLHNARRTPMEETMTADLWVLASQDAEQELNDDRLVRAKVAAAGIWPFLSAARTEREFGHRVALIESDLEELFPDTGFRDQVTASLRDDYRLLSGIVIQDFGTATLTSEASTATQDGGAASREAILATTAELAAAPSLFDHLALSDSDVPDGGTETANQGNPAFFDSGPEAGPATGNSQGFAQAAPDPSNPMNAQYPMQPGQWTVPPDKGWVERPMDFGKQGAHGDHATHYRGEGVETGAPGSKNPLYFDAPEGVTNGQDGFPPDPSLPEADERVDSYGAVPPQTGQPASPTPSYSNGRAASRYVAERDNFGACQHCTTPVYRDGDTWKHLGGDPGHGVRLHEQHPWVTRQQANRVMSSRTATRWVLGEASSSDTGGGDGGAGQAQVDPMGAPPTPQSMEPGGAGSVAGTPLTIPNDSVSTHPFAGQNVPQEPAMAGGMGMGVTAARYVVADTMNRPTAENPLGVESGDEFDLNNWDKPAEQRPRQDADSRRVNTPQRPGQPIPTRSSEGEPGGEEDEEERQ
jgi:hypothetical protein